MTAAMTRYDRNEDAKPLIQKDFLDRFDRALTEAAKVMAARN